MKCVCCVVAATAALAGASVAGAAVTVLYPDVADAQIARSAFNGQFAFMQTANNQNTLGNNGGFIYSVVEPFQLPALGAGQSFASAVLSFQILRNTNTPGFNGDVYGLPGRASPTVLASDDFLGASDPGASLLADNLVRVDNTDINAYVTLTVSGPALVNYLNGAYASGGAGSYAFLRLNADATPTNSLSSYFMYAAEYNFPGPTNDRRPTLTVTTVPGVGTGMVAMLGACAGVGRRRRR